jgi:hypothetical protein
MRYTKYRSVLTLERRSGSTVAHLAAMKSWVQIQLLPNPRQTLSVPRLVALRMAEYSERGDTDSNNI